MPKGKITAKGQVTIPKEVRRRLGLRTGDELDFVEDGAGFKVRKRLRDSPFAAYRGYLKDLAGLDPDRLVQDMRGK
ncbi:MAG: AbrB/MazE/SpoVT family DNA-binding domain-containing protein [Dehalococcoidia bacterium]|jgi:AbrB family looped-hinge helix DNA binding protein|nr:AbrB/MazE/SpoVT family DNA-binding domain-containing protein [Dehalococcoidia bacterium]